MLKYFAAIFAFLVLVVIATAGWRGLHSSVPPIEIFPDMDHQPKVKAQTTSSFFADGQGSRKPVAGTQPLGYSAPQHKVVDGSSGQSTSPYKNISYTSGTGYAETGRIGADWGTGMPIEVTPAVMARGAERFGIYCAACHGATGAGNGMAHKFGLSTVQSLLQTRIRVMGDGEIFNTIGRGKNTMMGLGDKIPVPDRWAVIAYVRALQKSQGGATLADVPGPDRAKLESMP